MAKIPFSDVTPPDRKRSIRNIPIPNGGRRKLPVSIKPPVSSDQPVNSPVEPIKSGAYEYYYPKNISENRLSKKFGDFGKKKYIFGGLALVAVAAFIVVMMTVFASATVLVTPKSQAVSVSESFVSAPEAFSTSTIRYEVMRITKSKQVSIPATGEEMAEHKASGKIMVYNNHSTNPQRLIIRTRFESPDGLIYRIPESIVVPGKTAAGPGSIEVQVFADEAGEKYNIGKVDFTIPGFKDDPERYQGFYARSVTEMAGGFVGKVKTVSESDKQTALNNIDTELQSLLEADFRSKLPENLVMLSKAIIFESAELPQQDESSSVSVGKEAVAYAVLFDKKNLSDFIISKYIGAYPDWANISAVIKDFSGLSLSGELDKAKVGEAAEFSIEGQALIMADISPDLISQELSGIPRSDIALVADDLEGVSSIRATIRPLWKRSFPENPSKIKVAVSIN